MLDNLIFCLGATVPIFAVILLGRVLRGRGMLSAVTMKDLDRLVFRIMLPVLLFRDISAGRITEQFDLRFFLFCAGTTTLYFFAIWLFAARALPEKSMVGAFTQGAFRGSQAVLGVAFVQSLYGDAGLVPLMIVATVPLYNVFAVVVLSVTAPREQTGGAQLVQRTLKSIVTNPIILAILAGLPFSILGVTFPRMIAGTIDMIAVCATPLALLSIGGSFEGTVALKKLTPTIWASVIKLIALPVIFLPIAVAMGFRGQALVAMLILYGAPSTVSGYVMAKNMNADHVLSSSIIVLTTAFSAVTLTVSLFILRTLNLV